jgi:uncharacterized repeat protein (TIGR03803 family)
MILRTSPAVRNSVRTARFRRPIALGVAAAIAALAPMSLASAATESTIFSFGGSFTFFPSTDLIIDSSGVLYGTTNGSDLGISTAYKLTPPAVEGGQYSFGLLYQFPSDSKVFVKAGLLAGPGGVFYSDAFAGGTSNRGIVFSLTPGPTSADPFIETTLYNFKDGADGGRPSADLVSDATGALYGTTTEGGTKGCTNTFGRIGCGVVFKLVPPAVAGGMWTEKVLYRFKGGADGNAPLGALMFDSKGVLYGTTSEGGASGRGTVFALFPTDTVWRHKVLHSFTGAPDGATPLAGLIQGPGNAFLGLTSDGGTGSCAGSSLHGCGVVYSITRSGMEKVLYDFAGGVGDGQNPQSELLALNGVFYGATPSGGTVDNGTVFKLTPPAMPNGAWTENLVYSFSHRPGDGAIPQAGLVADPAGSLYGTTVAGGSNTVGAAFKIVP